MPIAAILLLLTALHGQELTTEDATDTGLATGATAPAFELPDAAGGARTLDSLMGPKGLVLVFFRSADW